MKRTMVFGLVAAGCLIGYALPRPLMLAQAPAASGQGPARQLPLFTIDGSKFPRAQNGKGTIWTGEELRRKYITDPKGPTFDHIEWAPPYRITMQRRQPLQPGTTASGELHDDKT